jgi:hypothetical protein
MDELSDANDNDDDDDGDGDAEKVTDDSDARYNKKNEPIIAVLITDF